MAENSGSLVRRFGGLIAAVALVGLVLALYSDRPSVGSEDGYWDALREVGGAMLSGAVLAALVVWFEDRREDDRVERESRREDKRFELESAREDEAAKRAWRREIDIRFVAVVRTDLMAGRRRVLEQFDEDTRPSSIGASLLGQESRGRSFGDAVAEVDSLLEFLRDAALNDSWQDWSDSFGTLENVPAPTRSSASSQLGSFTNMPARRDLRLHSAALSVETSAWVAFLAAVNTYVAENYPTE